tara:strand:+ start:449 stop:958 length:510 start_codon:yes stop_codon:yes gene_type:complete
MQYKMLLELSKYLSILISSMFLLSCSNINIDGPRSDQSNYFVLDTIYSNDVWDFETGLINAVTKEKHGPWYFYRNDRLIRIVSFIDGNKHGPSIGFTSFKGVSSISTFTFFENGEYEGPSIRMSGDSMINYFDYYSKGNVMKSLFIAGNGDIEYSDKDSSFIVGKIPQD